MGLNFEYIHGQTPLDEEEKDGLLIPTIATQSELDEFEQQNIEDAVQWVLTKSVPAEKILTEHFVRDLHKHMYGEIWAWAGNFRKTNKNLGIDKWQIPMALKALLDDTNYWMENNIYGPDEVAIRFKHKIVSIHCFPNGNGRHSRLMADIIIDKIFNQPVFSWGSEELVKQSINRTNYIKAVKEADNNNYKPLLSFARS